MPWLRSRGKFMAGLALVCIPLVLMLWHVPGSDVLSRVRCSGLQVGQGQQEKKNRFSVQTSGRVVSQQVKGDVYVSHGVVVQEEDKGVVESGNDAGGHDEREFAWEEWGRMQCLRSVQERLRSAFEPIFDKYPGGVALVDVALHSNLGDNILWRGAVSLLASFGISPALVCYHSQPGWLKAIDKKAKKCTKEDIMNAVEGNGLVLFHAGGNWGDLYRPVQEKRIELLQELGVAAKTANFGIVQLPQSIYYSDTALLKQDKSVIEGLDPDVFHLFVRSKSSESQAQSMYVHTDVKLVPDIAFVLGPLFPPKRASYDVLILFRQDIETKDDIWSLTGWMKNSFGKANLTYKFQDWWYKPDEHPHEISENSMTVFSEVRLQAAMDLISAGKVVITNRLHGSIIATLMGKHLIYVDTKEGKISQVRDTAFASTPHCSNTNLHVQHSDNLKSAMEIAIEMLKLKESKFIYN